MRAICAIVASLVLAGTTFGDTINVPADYPTIQGAIDASSDGDEINIAAGTYYEYNLNPSGKAITIQGTLNGDGTLATTIDAQQNGNVFTIVSGEDNETVIQNLSITGGENASLDGGGIYCNQSSPTISSCTIFGNTANNRGGGISCYNKCQPIITGCTITDNSANEGGGVHYNNSNGTIINCKIEANTAANLGYGAGIHCYNNANPTISGCTISKNTTVLGSGGGIYCYNSNAIINSCTIEDNTAGVGGGISWEGDKSSKITAGVTNCLIFKNVAAFNGGGMCVLGDLTISIIDTIFDENRTSSSTGRGGALLQVPGQSGSITNLVIERCSFVNNIAGHFGGAVFVSSSSITFFDSCFAQDNIALNGTGGGIYSAGGIVSGINNVVCGNLPDQIFGNFVDLGDNYIELICSDPRGACCINGSALLLFEEDCEQVEGVFIGVGSNPNDVDCPSLCLGDANGDGEVSVNDILLVISQFGVTCP